MPSADQVPVKTSHSTFSALAQTAGRDGALDRKTKELIALAIAIAARCDGCIGFHMEALVRLGATRQEGGCR